MAKSADRTVRARTGRHYLLPALIPLFAIILMVVNRQVKDPYMVGVLRLSLHHALGPVGLLSCCSPKTKD